MSVTEYNWKRYWVPRGGRATCDRNGFLIPPVADAPWAKWYTTEVIGFDKLNKKSCLVLLGEPGIGKTFALKDFENRTSKAANSNDVRSVLINLNIFDDGKHLVSEIFESQNFRWWENGGGELHIFLDSYDECLFRIDTLTTLLAHHIRLLKKTENLFVRVACRTAEWRTPLEDALREKWGESSVGVYELCPLTEEQVKYAAEVRLLKSEQFIQTIKDREIVAFAIKPLTLELLFRIWKKYDGALPQTQREIYESGCLELCTESPTRQTPKLQRKHSAEERLSIASHIAAAMIFCKKSSVLIARRMDAQDSDISLAELADGSVFVKRHRLPVTESALKETIDTGLFSSRGRDCLGWAHQTYAEFLAARYLEKQGFTVAQMLSLLKHPNDPDHKLVPQLQEAAAWVAGASKEVFTSLINVQPDVLLRSDVATGDVRSKQVLVEALLDYTAFDFIHGDWDAIRKSYRKLRHPGLGKQLRKYICNKSANASIRMDAIRIAGECESEELVADFIQMALDQNEDTSIREWAAIQVNRLGSETEKAKLKPLALGQCGPDRKDGLRGVGLTACWPKHLNSEEFFNSFKLPEPNIAGFYRRFISDKLVLGLEERDLPRALAWAKDLPQLDFYSADSVSEALNDLISKAQPHLGNPTIRKAFAELFLARFRRHEHHFGKDTMTFNRYLQENPLQRLELVKELVSLFEDPRNDAIFLTRYGISLVVPEDLFWILNELKAALPNQAQRNWAYLILYIYYPVNSEVVDLIVDAANNYTVLAETLAAWLKPISLDSPEAVRLRDSHFTTIKLKHEMDQRRQQRILVPHPFERIKKLLDESEAGNVNLWWRIVNWFEITEDGSHESGYSSLDIRVFPFWKNASEDLRRRIVALAHKYVLHGDPEPDKWFNRKNIVFLPAVAGFRALMLLHYEAPSVLDSISANIWQKWTPIIFECDDYANFNEHRVLTKRTFKNCPTESNLWLSRTIDRENKRQTYPLVLQKLPLELAHSWGSTLFQKLNKGKLRPQFLISLTDFLAKNSVPGVLDFIRSKIPKDSPKNASRRQVILSYAHLLLLHGENSDWQNINRLISSSSAFGRDLFESSAREFYHAPANLLRTLYEDDIKDLWKWMLKQYPVATDPDRTRGGTVDTRYAMANLRDNIIYHLAEIGTNAACEVLASLHKQHPKLKEMLSWQLSRAKEKTRRNTWQPLSPSQLFALGESSQKRLVQSADQLLNVVTESIERFQETLKGENPQARFLWFDNRPRLEKDLTDLIAHHFKGDLVGKGIIVGREVQIHVLDRLDLRVDAVAEAGADGIHETVSVILEIKGCWNREIKIAMETQLAQRYLKNIDCRHGIYLVGWFLCNNWRGKNPSRKAVKFRTIHELEKYLSDQASSLSINGKKLIGMVLDITIPKSKKQTGRKKSKNISP